MDRRSATMVAMLTVGAVLLDMDGTLVDSDAAVERAWRRWAAEYGIDADEVLAVAHGVPADATAARFLPGRPATEVAAAAARQLWFQYDDLSDVAASRGALVLVAALQDKAIPWAVVTSADRRLALARIGAAGIEPPLLVTCEDVVAGKPDPACYLLAASQLGVAPADCLVVEDSPAGVAAGRAAGARTAGLRGLDADIALADLADLASVIATIDVRPGP
jgi:mannitol-1-/sugar-/sorbitol-6-phosphatase